MLLAVNVNNVENIIQEANICRKLMSKLDLSKYFMYDLQYNVMKPKYGNKLEICYKDTVNLKYHIETKTFYNNTKIMIDYFDTSDYKK